jgi:hypothetical protein
MHHFHRARVPFKGSNSDDFLSRPAGFAFSIIYDVLGLGNEDTLDAFTSNEAEMLSLPEFLR